MPALWWEPVMACTRGVAGVCRLWLPNFGDSGNGFSGHPDSVAGLVPRQCVGLQRVLGLKKYKTAWTMLHKLRRAMVRPGRELLAGRIEVDESYVGARKRDYPVGST